MQPTPLRFILPAALICAAVNLVPSASATVSLEIDAGILRNATGTSTVPVGGLLQLVATPSGSAANFVQPTATSFVGGDNVVVASFAMNYFFGTGETDNVVTLTLQNIAISTATTFDQGDPLLLRWYPTLTISSTAPGIGATYGQFRSDSGEAGGIAWVTPADGTSLTVPNGLNFLTMAASGTHPDVEGFASSIVSPVPEPSIYILLGLGFGGLTFGLVHRRRGMTSHRRARW